MKPRPATGHLDADFGCVQRVRSDSLGNFELAVQQPVWAWLASRPEPAERVSTLRVASIIKPIFANVSCPAFLRDHAIAPAQFAQITD